MLLVFDFLENLALLTLVGLGTYGVETNRARLGEVRTQILHGLVFGTAAFLVTATPLTLSDEATLDTRAGPVILAGVVGGPIGGLLAAAGGALSRGLVGGNFAFSGVAVYFVYGIIGIALGQTRTIRLDTVLKPVSIFTLTLVSYCGAGAMFFLIQPRDLALSWLAKDLPLIFGANTISVVYTAFVVGAAMVFARKNAEVKDLNERLELAKRAGRFGTWDYNLRTGRLEWDARSAEMHGLDPGELEGALEHWVRYVDPDDLRETERAFQDSLENDVPFNTEYRVYAPGSATRVIMGSAVVVRATNGTPERVVGANLDLTELRTAEADLAEAQSIAVQAQKFDTIGKMTGGVAHDFNNLLAIIMGNQELLRDAVVEAPRDLDAINGLIDASLQATRRGADLTQNLLAYARQARLKPEPVDLNQVVRQTETWLRRTIESRIDIESVLQAGVWTIQADRASIQSALVNLVINARDALDGPGKITIETANIRIDGGYLEERAEDVAPGRYVMLAVSDTGGGIPDEILRDIFDPFFTTKPVGKGTGLGLSMVQGFVKQSGGTVRVYSEPGAGTCFKLYFPVTVPEGAPPEPKPDIVAEVAPNSQARRILVVEDEEELLSVMQQSLCAAGYSVVCANSGDAAFEIFRADPSFDLVASDIVMPGSLQGPALAKAIRALDPDMRFVFFSGYAREAVLHGNGLRSDDISLMKPVARRDLLAAVRSALEPPKGRD